MNENETIIDIGAELISAGEGRVAYRVRRGDECVPVTFADIARRMFAAHSRDVLAAVQEAGRIHAACVRAGCVHAGEAVCPGGSAPGECDRYAKKEARDE